MSLRKANISWNNNQLANMIEGGKISFDNIIQRSFVWERERKSRLIESMIIGYPVPPVYAKRGEDKVFDLLDGKQRLCTVKEFLRDEFELTDLPPVTIANDATNEVDEYNISKMKYSELPEPIRDIVKTFNITVYYFDDITEDEEREMFKRLNAGKPLTTKERNIANCGDIKTVIRIGQHKLFDSMYTEKALAKKQQLTVIMKAYMMLNEDIKDVSFEGKKFNPYIETIEVSEMQEQELNSVFDMLYAALVEILLNGDDVNRRKIAKKILKKDIHVISLIPFAVKAIENQISEVMFANWIADFFNGEEGTTISEVYNTYCLGSTARNDSILTRHNALLESYEEYFESDSSDSEEESYVDTAVDIDYNEDNEMASDSVELDGIV